MTDKFCEIFKTGKHTDSAGNEREWTDADLETIKTNFEEKNPDVPICCGHPKTNSPAYGWVKTMKIEGGKLYASFKDVVPEFVEAVKKGLFKTRSISLSADLVPRHIAFLGAQAPAIKGMEQFCFAQDDNDIKIEFENASAGAAGLRLQGQMQTGQHYDTAVGNAGEQAPSTTGGKNASNSENDVRNYRDNVIAGEVSPATQEADCEQSNHFAEGESPAYPFNAKWSRRAEGGNGEFSTADPFNASNQEADCEQSNQEGDKMKEELEKLRAEKDAEIEKLRNELAQKNSEALKKEYEEFCDQAVAEGHILPKHRQNVLDILFANTDTSVNFEDGTAKSSNEVFKDFIKSLKVMDFEEIADPKKVKETKEINFSDANEVKEAVIAMQKEYSQKGIELNPAEAYVKLKGDK